MARQRAIGYARVSTAEQAKGWSLRDQAQTVRDYCRANDLRLVGTFSDGGESGANGLDSRRGLAEVLARCEAGEATAVVLPRLDRLARDLVLCETVLDRLRGMGVDVVSADPGEADISSEDPTRTLIRQVVGAVAQYERAVIRGRMVAGAAAKRRRGGYAAGRPPFGKRAMDGELADDPTEQSVIEEVARLRRQGASLRTIATHLTEAGYPTKAGTRWHPNTVARVAARLP